MSDLSSKNGEILDRFLATAFWETIEAENELLSKDCSLEFPYAPPGMPKAFDRPRRPVLISSLRRTMTNWSRDSVFKYPTLNPARFWVESRTVADYYVAAGMNLPVFHFSGLWDVTLPAKAYAAPDCTPSTEEAATALRQQLFDYFHRPKYADSEREGPKKAQWFTEDFMPCMPFNPKGMMRDYTDHFYESCNCWLRSTLVQWDQQVVDFHEDKFLDPNVAIVEANGTRALVKWDPSGATSGYFNDYVIMVKLRDFQITEVKEWLDPVNQLLAAGAMVPCFPFYY